MKDIRGQAKREAEYYASNPIQACPVCGRYFTRRGSGELCSIACAEKSKEIDER
jgi:hypothetical protein